MTAEEALALLDTLLQGSKLKDVQELVFRYSWQGWTYPEIAQHLGYDDSYIRDVGYELWRQLTQELGEQVTKKNVQTVMLRQVHLRPVISEPLGSLELESLVIDAETPLAKAGNLPSGIAVTEIDRTTPPSIGLVKASNQYWGEIIDVSSFYGRSTELMQLQQWVIGGGTHPEKNRCRLVAILGMGGMGKTTLAAKLVEQIRDEFEFVIWQSLRNAPPIAEVLTTSIQCLSKQQEPLLPLPIGDLMAQLIEYLRSCRCLLIFDNFDTVLRGTNESVSSQRSLAGQCREGFEEYEEILGKLGSELHSSCLLLTSREKPKILTPLEGKTLPVRVLSLAGLSAVEMQGIFKVDGCFTQAETDWDCIRESYAGNPLALKIVSTTVRDVFDGSITEFLAQGSIAFGDINLLLNEQFRRLSNLEKQVLYWLAIKREWVSLAELREDFVPSPPQHILLETLLSLVRRSLIEKGTGSFTLQPVVMEYVIEQLLKHICEELETQELNLFISHALIEVQGKDYIRESQIHVILEPLAQRLLGKWRSKKEVEYQLKSILFKLRSEFPHSVGYAGGNSINLLHQLQIDLTGYDFSHLSIWQAYLVDTDLYQVNFTHADFSKSVFKQTFGGIFSIAFSPDGKSILAGDSIGQVLLWRVADGQPLWSAIGHTQWVRSVAFGPDGETLASSSLDGTIKLWDVRTGQLLQTLSGQSAVRAVIFSPDGTMIASGGLDRTVRLWDTQTGQLLQTWQGHTNLVKSLAFSPDGTKIVSGSFDRTLKIWEVGTGELLETLAGHDGIVLSVDWSPDGATIASGGGDNINKLWSASTGKLLRSFEGHTHWVCCLQFSPDGQTLVSGSDDRTVKLWDVSTGQLLRSFSGHRYWVMAVAFNADGTIIASGSEDQTVKFWEVSTGKLLNTLSGYSNSVLSIAWSPDGQMLASSSADYTASLWDTNTRQHLKRFLGHTHWVWSIAFSPDGTLLASGSDDHTTKLWTVNSGSWCRTFEGSTHWALSIAFSPDGTKLATGSMDQGVWLWDVANERVFQRWQGHSNLVWSVIFSPDGQILASGGDDHTAKLWDVQSGQVIQTLVHPNSVLSVKFSADQTAVITGGADCMIRLWDLSTEQVVRTFYGHTDQVLAIALNREGSLIASGSADQTVRLWDINTGQLLQTFLGHTYWVHSVAFSPNGERLASGSGDGTIKLWDVKTGEDLTTLRTPRPYEGMNIIGATGFTEAQKKALKVLGAIELN
jgi:WD40 repeat protein